MFGKKHKIQTQLDPDQLERIENAQRRIKQKKRLHTHFILFLIVGTLLLVGNLFLKIGATYTYFEIDWSFIVILLWVALVIYHTINVYITHKFMGKAWEKAQLNKLVAQQENRIEKLKLQLEKEELIKLKSANYSTTKAITTQNTSKLTIIAAAAENNVIGKDNKLIWHISDDLKRFKRLTNGHHIIMGRKTFESFPKPLPNRTHVVITNQANYNAPDGVIIVNSLEQAIKACKNDEQPFIIGGGEIYKQSINIAQTIELTRVHDSFEGDTLFPEINSDIWQQTQTIYHEKSEKHKHAFSFITYVKR